MQFKKNLVDTDLLQKVAVRNLQHV